MEVEGGGGGVIIKVLKPCGLVGGKSVEEHQSSNGKPIDMQRFDY